VWFGGIGVSLVGIFSAVIFFSPWRRERIFAYLNPWDENNALGKSYQLSHSLIAFGRGEIFGVGLGGSVEKLHYLPEAHTDFLLAVIGEELGFVGVMVVIMLFYWLIKRAFDIGRQAIALDMTFSGLVAKGIGIWIGVQTFINMGVNLGVLPTKGLTLPLMSYGGTGILINCVGLAILLRIDFESRSLMRGGAGMSQKRLMIMAAGTGGHIFPGLAIAATMRAQGWQVTWLGTSHGMEVKLVAAHGIDMDMLEFSGLRGKGLRHSMTGVVRLVTSFFRSVRYMRQRRPDVVLGMGGYVTVRHECALVWCAFGRGQRRCCIIALEQSFAPCCAQGTVWVSG